MSMLLETSRALMMRIKSLCQCSLKLLQIREDLSAKLSGQKYLGTSFQDSSIARLEAWYRSGDMKESDWCSAWNSKGDSAGSSGEQSTSLCLFHFRKKSVLPWTGRLTYSSRVI